MTFKRTNDVILEIASKINKLIEIYAESEGLMPYITKETQKINTGYEKIVDSVLDAHTFPAATYMQIEVYRIKVTVACSESKDILKKDYFQTLSSFVSDSELEDQLAARYFPDYLTIKNIFSILLYEVPRKVQKTDLEHLNKLYKKYNVNFY